MKLKIFSAKTHMYLLTGIVVDWNLELILS